MRDLRRLAAVAAINLCTLPAWAVPFTATIPDHIGPLGRSDSVSANITSPGASAAGAATLTFDLLGYGGIDGNGPRISTLDVADDFGFRVGDPSLNGVFFSVMLNMGGANPGVPFFGIPSPDTTIVSYTDNGPGLGGQTQFKVMFTLLSGDNDFAFQYGCCSPSNGSEEGWGLRNLVVTADLPGAAAPEPMTLSLLLAGLVGIGATVRRRRAAA